ncbi:hypothetical protein HYPSUDRAFT_210262 [Hypholoma sublateritium FD-334 SS-4]|uniref:Uncharacterized protein n=1 Tax=Hypholoma sublateritium (strain FD-334 SS-4) TaxID=945553 RepID=A0A0D2NVW2_HYPSF|nr:hypothetical protein HYPSUDRAFT_210262 [Hypholoma sublateritium FD-334 SS-4]
MATDKAASDAKHAQSAQSLQYQKNSHDFNVLQMRREHTVQLLILKEELNQATEQHNQALIDIDVKNNQVLMDVRAKHEQAENEYKATISNLTLRLESIEEDMRNVEAYWLSEDPICMLRIKLRAVIDRAYEVLYSDVTELEPDKLLHNVKQWITIQLNPPAYKKATCPDIRTADEQKADRDYLDNYRYNACLALLSAKKLDILPQYQALISSNSLKFLTQSSIDLRNQANLNAHTLAEMSELRQFLDRAKTDNVIDSICSPSDLSGIEGTMAFVEFFQTKPKVGKTTTKTTVEFKIVMETTS